MSPIAEVNGIIFSRRLQSLTTVSYTHLDVYKRQTESLVDDLSELDPNGEYGIEFEDEVALETHYKPNADESGFVGK